MLNPIFFVVVCKHYWMNVKFAKYLIFFMWRILIVGLTLKTTLWDLSHPKEWEQFYLEIMKYSFTVSGWETHQKFQFRFEPEENYEWNRRKISPSFVLRITHCSFRTWKIDQFIIIANHSKNQHKSPKYTKSLW